MNLGQFGTLPVNDASEKPYCEAPDVSVINNIRDSSFARDVEDCEIDKSNILLLGPTGSGKVCCGRLLRQTWIPVPKHPVAHFSCLYRLADASRQDTG